MVSSTSGSPLILFLLLCHKCRNRHFLFFILLFGRHTDILFQFTFIMPASLFQIRNTDFNRNIFQIFIRICKGKSLLYLFLHSLIIHFIFIPVLQIFLLHLVSCLDENCLFCHLTDSNLFYHKLRDIIVNPRLFLHEDSIFPQKFTHGPMPHQCRQYKSPVILCFHSGSQWEQFFFLIQKTRQRQHLLFQLSDCSCKDQFLFCSCHGNVKYPQFLSQTLFQKLSSDHLLIQRRCDHPFLRYDSISPYSQFRMKQKTCIHILKIKLFSHTGHKYYRKFKSLTLVDRHDLHCGIARSCQIDFSIVYLICL